MFESLLKSMPSILDDLKEVSLPEPYKTEVSKFKLNKKSLSGTYSDLALTNLVYIGNRDKGKKSDVKIADIFGFENPYESTNFVYGKREKCNQLSGFNGTVKILAEIG